MKKAWKSITVYCSVICALLLGANLGSQTITTWVESRTEVERHCIVIDPGHGGEDGGAISHSGIPESSYNLEIALRLNDLLNFLGYDTKMIRKTDISIYTKGEILSQKKVSDLKERVKLVNETQHAVLLSIHQNHYPDDRCNGAQVFYANTEGSESLAKQLQSAIISTLNPSSRRQEKKCSGIYLMEHIQCPAVLIECGFLSNAKEEAKLKTPEYQKKMSSVIATTICQYLSNT